MSGVPQTVVSFPEDIGNPLALEFLSHPDFRVVAGFLLGWIFWSSIRHAFQSRFFQLLGQICWALVRGSKQLQSSDVEAQNAEKQVQQGRRRAMPNIYRVSNEAALTFTLNLCFAFVAFAEFCTLLVFDVNGNTACAFTMAWGGVATQAARLIGIMILVLELRHRGASNMEFYGLCIALIISLSFILAYTATNTGGIVLVNTLGVFLCARTSFLPTAVLSSIAFILLELYVCCRFISWGMYKTSLGAMLAASANVQVARASSLLLLDLLIVVPNAITTTELAQFIPLSIGALIVLGVFNHSVTNTLADPVSRAPSPVRSLHARPSPLPISRPHNQLPSQEGAETPSDQQPTRPEAPDTQSVAPVPSVTRPREQPAIVVPSSAPPRIGVFEESQTRRILPFQVQYAERFQRNVHQGPIVVPVRHKPQRPHVQVVIEDMEPHERSRTMPSIIGSDILRKSSAATSSSRQQKKPWSPDSSMTPSDYTASRSGSDAANTPVNRTPTTVRDSALSMLTSRSLSTGSRQILSASTSRQSSRKKRSPAEYTAKMPWRSATRTSFASGRTFGGRDELSIVVEGQAESSGSRRTSGISTATKGKMISRPQSLRASRPSSPQFPRLGGQRRTTFGSSRPQSSQLLTVPDHLRSPVSTPTTSIKSSIRPSSQYIVPSPTLPDPPPRRPSPSLRIDPTAQAAPPRPPSSYGRAEGSGRLRGPRSPPMSSSTPNLRTEWPSVDQGRSGDPQRNSRRRSGSCPELPPLELGVKTFRPLPNAPSS